jgi:hypothetical protein
VGNNVIGNSVPRLAELKELQPIARGLIADQLE